MSSRNDDTILPSRPLVTSGGLDGDTLLPYKNVTGMHVAGDVIDNRYTVIREIGRGGMGVVYEVEDSITSVRHAIKRLLPESASNESIVRAFVREGTTAERFSARSQYLVTTKSIGRDASGFYVLMELVAFPTLRQVLKSSRSIKVDRAIPILTSLAAALADLHKSGLIHRDLKPENIFLDETEHSADIQLVDFGLTRDVSSHTITGLNGAGSLKYMAPEQFRDEPATMATDVYAFGVIAYELLSGELPQYGETLSDVVPYLPVWLVDIVSGCLAGRLEKRIVDGVALRKLLDQQVKVLSPSIESPVVQPGSVTEEPIEAPTLELLAEPVLVPVEQLSGTLILSGIPDGSQILLDGREVTGTHHTVGLNGAAEQIELVISCDGFQNYSQKVLLAADQSTTESVRMERIVARQSSRINEYPHLKAYVESMRDIPAGTFQMGRKCWIGDTKPVHSVKLSAFRMGATPITVAIWKEYCSGTGVTVPQAPPWGLLDDHPIVNVSWKDIMGTDGKSGFSAWVSEVAGYRVRLPTEAQFEYTSRGGKDGQEFPWGNTFFDDFIWCSNEIRRTATIAVDRKTNQHLNTYGLTDMSGNVWQWCSDWYGPYSTEDETDPKGQVDGTSRSIRGGSWSDKYIGCFHCAGRLLANPETRQNDFGFRITA